MKRLLLLVVLVAAEPLFACAVTRFDILPARPTTSDELEVVVSGGCPDGCIPRSPRVDVKAGTIEIDLEWGGGCILVPQPWGERVRVGRLPAGTYEVIVTRNAGPKDEEEVMARGSVIVRDVPFTLVPSFGPAGTEVLIDLPTVAAPKVVTFGGVAGTVRTIGDQVIAVAPGHAPGLVDVVVTGVDGNTFTAPGAYLYPTDEADLSAEYERVFFPSIFAGAGAHGSLWTSRNVIRNAGPVDVPALPAFAASGAGERVALPAANRDGGQFVMVPRGMEGLLAFGSHIVDESRRQGDAGTEMPVVHERETGAQLKILDVPLTAESRQTLRIFDFEAVPGRMVTIAFDTGDGFVHRVSTVLGTRIVCVRAPCYPEHPTFAVVNLDLIREIAGAKSADITIYAATNDVPLWAYVSVTNNDTQHVTLFTPQ